MYPELAVTGRQRAFILPLADYWPSLQRMKAPEPSPRSFSPWLAALVLAITYLVIASGWIVMSSAAVPAFTSDVLQSTDLEIYKGLAFVVVTGLGIFLFAWIGLRLRERLVAEILTWREATAATERQAIAGVLASSVAHDINNVLMVLGAHLPDPDPDVAAGLERLGRLSRDLHRISQPHDETSEAEVELASVLADSVRFARAHEQLSGRKISTRTTGDVVVRMPHVLFDRAVLNLLLNAGEAAGKGGEILVTGGVEGDDVFISVEDSGPGFGGKTFAEVARPWSTTRERGSGLGLVTVRALADRLPGTVTIGTSADLGGAKITLSWRHSARAV